MIGARKTVGRDSMVSENLEGASSFRRRAQFWLQIHLTVFIVAAVVAPKSVWAGSPRDELLRLVPEDVGFCAVVQNLREHFRTITGSPFVHYFKATPLGAQLLSAPELQKLDAADQFLQEHFHVTVAQIRDDLLGDALVLCYRPGPPGKPDMEQGMLLLHARNEKLLVRLLEEIQDKQRESGELQSLDRLSYRGLTYYRRTERSKPPNYYFVDGKVFAFSSQEAILRQALERARSGDGRNSALVTNFRKLGQEKALAALWVNPRAFDAGLDQKASEAKGAHALALRTVKSYWRALDGIALSLVLGEDIELSAMVLGRAEDLSAASQRLAAASRQSSTLWDSFPENALVAVATRIDVAALLDFVQEFLGKEQQASAKADLEKALGAIVGQDSVRGLVSQLGPDLGFVIVPPGPADAAWLPQGLAALQVRNPSKGERTDLTIYNLLNTLGTLAVYHLNSGRPGNYRLRTTVVKDTEIKVLENDQVFPNGLRPSFALKEGYLLLATSPEVISRFQPHAVQASAHSKKSEVSLLRISFTTLHDYVNQRKNVLAKMLAEKNHISTEEARNRLGKLQDTVQFLSTLRGTSTLKEDRATLTFKLSLARPLK